jgi:hypothetical protein
MFELIKLILEKVREFINKYFPILSDAITEVAEIIGLIKTSKQNIGLDDVIDISHYVEVTEKTENIPMASPYFNDFFSSKEEEESYFHDLALFSTEHKLRPELVYYMFCCDRKVNGTKLDNEMQNFLSKKDNIDHFMSFLSDYPKLKDLIIVNGAIDMQHSKRFNSYIRTIIFESDPNFNYARYTSYFYTLTKS